MDVPKGFDSIVKEVMKEPAKKIEGNGIWDCYIRAALIGGGRSEADNNLIISLLNKQDLLSFNKINKLSGDKWSEEAEKILKKNMDKLEYEEDKTAINSMLKEMFRITASLKGSARFFEKKNVIQDIDKLTKDDDATNKFIDELADDEDVSNVRHTKVILWLHSIGRARHAIPATRQVKAFINNAIGPYYQYYEDDKYFINKARELSEEIKKKIKNATEYDVTRAIFYYITIKSMVPRGYGKAFTCTKFLEFLKKNKLTLKKISNMTGDIEDKFKLMELVDNFARSIKKSE